MNKMNELILATAAIFALCGGATAASAAGSSDEPTAEELKHSKDRGLMAVPLPTVSPTNTPRGIETVKPAEGIKTVKTVAPVNKTTVKKSTTGNTSATPHKAHQQPANSSVAKKTTGSGAVIATKKPQTVAPRTFDEGQPTAAAYTTGDVVLKVWLNKSGSVPHFKSGEKMEINVSASKDCNLMIFDFDGRGKLTQLFPNQFQPASAVKAGETVAIGGDNSSFDYTASLPDGEKNSQERIFVYAYPVSQTESAPISVAMSLPSDSAFRSGEMTVEQYRKMVNSSPVFFNPRDVKITPKSGVKVASASTGSEPAPNKYELPFVIEK